MLQKNNKYRLLRLFFQQPTAEFQLRQLSRLSKIALPSTKRYLEELEKEGLVLKMRKVYPVYRAARDTVQFRNLKKWFLAIELTKNGFTDYVVDKCSPDSIVLFGSAARGEDIENSDIDVAIIAEEISLEFKKYEKTFGRKISLVFVPKFSKVSNELKNNILNGIILYGYVKVF